MEIPAEFRPEQFSRRGELTAWGLTILAFGAWVAFRANGLRVSWIYILLALFMLLGALASSLTNWVDRHTVLRLEPDGISFENGLRRVWMAWSQVKRVQVLPMQLSKMVRVNGADGQYFSFRTFGEVEVRGRRGRVGFIEGEQILEHILENSGVKRSEAQQNGNGGDYYTRE